MPDERETGMAQAAPNSSTIRFDCFEVDAGTGDLRQNGVTVRLQPQPLHLLLALLRQPGRVVSREELRRSLWPEETFVDFDDGLHQAAAKLREALGDSAQSPRYIGTVPRRGYRFIAQVTTADELSAPRRFSKRILWFATAAGVLVLVAVSAVVFHIRRTSALTERDFILLADFTNTTGDPVFDATLKQAVAVQLGQSPYLSILSERRVQETLAYMERPTEERVTGAVAAEVCQRCGVKAMLRGEIARLGGRYVIGLEAVNCVTGGPLAHVQETADSKEKVLEAISKASSGLRRNLGESVRSVQRYDVPLQEASTSSLEALKAYSLGRVQVNRGAQAEAITHFLRAVELDSSFASAYVELSLAYGNLLRDDEANKYATKAFELRQRVSERERLDIESRYTTNATRDFLKTVETLQQWVRTYPRDPAPRRRLAFRYQNLGQFEKALAEGREAIRLDPTHPGNYWALTLANLALNRSAEAKAAAEDAVEHKHDNWLTHFLLYEAAFVLGDADTMRRQVEWAKGQPEEHALVAAQAASAAFFGRLAEARSIYRRAIELAARNDDNEHAAVYTAGQALIEASFGNHRQARELAAKALAIDRARRVLVVAALTLARTGDRAQAGALAEELRQRLPKDLPVNAILLPAIRAEIGISRGQPARALDHLQAALPYEFVIELGYERNLTAVEARARALLAAGDGAGAAREFQKILDHRGLVPNHPAYALAHLGLARALLLAGDTAKSRKAYEDFLALWKEADPDIPVLRQARSEYGKLK
jgi:DNA-binding winged helix-turn-helix (wHTH) protein/tetratricopeptide (TPR) repeat protein